VTAWDRFLRLSPSFDPGSAYVELPDSILDVDGEAALGLGEIDPPAELASSTPAGGTSRTS
jgi:hypothetical protein